MALKPGTSYNNPVWHGDYRIYRSDPLAPNSCAYEYVHDDYDGAEDANDGRCGHGRTIEECKDEIDDFHQDPDTLIDVDRLRDDQIERQRLAKEDA